MLTWSTGPCSASTQNYGPLSALEAPWTETLVVGDSGNPAFLAPGGELVLVTTHLTPNGGPNISQYIPQINALMGGGYSLTAYAYEVQASVPVVPPPVISVPPPTSTGDAPIQ